MQNRREFIKYIGIGGLSIGLAPNNVFSTPLGNTKSVLSPNNETEWSQLRSEFILSEKISYLNNGTMGVSPKAVFDEAVSKMRYADENGHYGGGEKEACDALAKFLNVHQDEIGLTHNVTEGTNIILMGLSLPKGSEIICTSHEHAGTAQPLMHKAKLNKLKLVPIDIEIEPDKTTANILNAITNKTKLICIPHMPCTTGQLLDVKKICAEASKMNILTLIDGAHPPGMLRVDLKDVGCDFYVGCGHKWMLGPKGTGFLYVKKEKLDLVQTIFEGAGTHANYLLNKENAEMTGRSSGSHRFYYGSQNAGLYFGLVKSISFLETISMEKVEQRVKFLSGSLKKQLKEEIPSIEFYCPDEEMFRTGVTSFKIKGKNSQEICSSLRAKDIITRHVHENKLDLVRVSTHIYNSPNEMDRLVQEIKSL